MVILLIETFAIFLCIVFTAGVTARQDHAKTGYVVQLDSAGSTPKNLRLMRLSHGAVIFNSTSVIVSLSKREFSSFRNLYGVDYATPVEPHHRFNAGFFNEIATDSSLEGKEVKLAVSIICRDGIVADSFRETLVYLRDTYTTAHSYTACRRTEHGSDTILMTTSRNHVLRIISKLSSVDSVLWIEEKPKYSTFNHWAVRVCHETSTYVPLSKREEQLYSNLTGKGIVIGIADTGLDANSCFFYDPDHSVPYDTISYHHRKIAYYGSHNGDRTDTPSGHGTHVSGTAAGMTIEPGFTLYNGFAYGAKVAFFDLQRGSSGNLNVPDNMGDMFGSMYAAGARIFSNSWGDPRVGNYANSYTLDAREVDIFMYDHPDALILFAAGNNGEHGSHTAAAPSTNKNGLSVGASLTMKEGFEAVKGKMEDSSFAESGVAYFSSVGPTRDGRLKPDVTAPGDH